MDDCSLIIVGMSNTDRDLFLELLQVALGNREALSRVPTKKEWMTLYRESEKQSILGMMLDGLERLPDEQRAQQDILLQ